VKDLNIADFYQFWLFLLLMVLSWVSMAVVVSIGDAICFEMLGKSTENCKCVCACACTHAHTFTHTS